MLFIFDENFSQRLAEGLNLLEQGNTKSPRQCKVEHIIKLIGKGGEPDEVVIETAGKHKGIIITQDKDFKRIKHYYSLYEKHKVGVIHYKTSKKVMYYWDIVTSFIKRWEEIKEIVDGVEPPFLYSISVNGFSKETLK